MKNLEIYTDYPEYQDLYELFKDHLKTLKAIRRQERRKLALANGVRDESYDTVRYGRIPSYAGRAEFATSDGTKWRAIGHSPKGTPERVSEPGYIEYTEVP